MPGATHHPDPDASADRDAAADRGRGPADAPADEPAPDPEAGTDADPARDSGSATAGPEAVPEADRYALRRGGWLGVADDAVYVVRDETVRVDRADVAEVAAREFDYFLLVTSLGLAAFGLYATRFSLPGGLAFAAAGVASLALTYRKRGRLTVRVDGRPKPLRVRPSDPGAAYGALAPAAADGRGSDGDPEPRHG